MTAPDSSSPDGQTLYRLLGIAPGVSDERLRHVYEWAVADASRRGNHQALLMLSRAFDKVKSERKVYRSAGRPTGPVPPPISGGTGRYPPRPGSRSARTARRRPGLKRTLGYGVAIAAVIGVFTFLAINSGQGRPPSTPADQQVVVHERGVYPQPSQPTTPVMSVSPLPRTTRAPLITHGRGIIVVPKTAPTAADGLVRILCQLDGTTDGYLQAASRGSKTSCTNGATPRILG